MKIIANNMSTRVADVDYALRSLREKGDPDSRQTKLLKDLAWRCCGAGADALEINLQQHNDTPEVMETAVKAVQEIADCQLCLSTNNPKALQAGLTACKRPPMVNYLSFDEARVREMLPLAVRHRADVVLLVSDPAAPGDARDMLMRAAILIGAANEAGIPNDRIYVDPGIIHVNNDIGQRHLVEARQFLSALPEAFDPPVKSTAWLGSIATGASPRLRVLLESTLLTALWSIGLSAVFMDVLSAELMRAVRMQRMFDNEIIYSDAEVELQEALL